MHTTIAAPPATSPPATPTVDWEDAIRLPAFLALVRSRRRFVTPAAFGAFAWITLWLVLVAFAPHLMGQQVATGVSLMYATGLSQFVLVGALAWAYLRRSRLVWAPLQRRAIAELQTMIGDR